MTMVSIIGFLILLCLAVLLQGDHFANADDSVIVDCHPEKEPTEDVCKARGCKWSDKTVEEGAPVCTFPSGYGYSVVDTWPTEWGYSVHLTRNQGQPSIYGNDVEDVYLSIENWDQNILRLKFYDPNNARYEVPVAINQPSTPASQANYRVDVDESDPQFGLYVRRLSSNTIIFDTRFPGFVFSNQFLQITAKLGSSNVYGVGEQRHMSYAHDLNWRTWSMFSRDAEPNSDWNVYGTQPFYMNLEKDGSANGVLLLNSNAMEVTLQPASALTYRTIGGILDFYIFLGPSPENVVEQYTSLVGRPMMPPYWSLGFQLCRWGYENTSVVRAVVERTRAAKIPQDVQWNDADYMDHFKDFTLSKTAFADLPALIDDIHAHGQKFIVIIDAGVAEDPQDLAYQEGIKEDVFIKYENGTLIHGHVWPGPVVYPDFSHENSLRYWSKMFRHLYEDLNVTYDGIWLDMNEPSDFDYGSATGCVHNELNFPPYVPHILGADQYNGMMYAKTICMDAVQRAGRHYDVHSLFGYLESEKTFYALKEVFPRRRPLIISRSQYSGSGQYASHWLGDNASTWQAIKDAIVGIMEYNIFGIPFVGADICGFNGATTVELCARWMQVGAFYPFCRNHNNRNEPEQDPAILGPVVVNASIRALTQRYRLLPYLYTLLQKAHDHGSTVARPLLHEFPRDSNTWNMSTQFLWGSALMISPVLDEGVNEVDIYFPDARWYDYYTGTEVNRTDNNPATVDAPLDGDIPLHVAGGNIIPTQEPAMTTAQSRNNSLGLIVALDDSWTAFGNLYWDDGEAPDTRSSGHYNEFQFVIANNVLDIIVLNNGLGDMNNVELDSIKFYGVAAQPTAIKVDGFVLDPSHVSYNDVTNVLELTQLDLKMPKGHLIALN